MLNLPIVSGRRTSAYRVMKALLIALVVLLVASIFFFNLSGVFIALICLGVLVSEVSLSHIKEHIEIGEIIFSNNETFTIRRDGNQPETTYQIDEIKNFELVISTYKKAVTSGVSFVYEGTSGLGNYLKFKDKSGVNHSYEFFIKTESQMKSLRNYKKHLMA